jgi:protein SCO1/2
MKLLNLKQSLFTITLVLTLLGGAALVDYLVQLSRSEGAVAPGTEADIGASFSLIDQSGKPVTNADFADKYKLIFFGFTHCPDVCPTTLSRMSRTLEQLGPLADQLYPLFITVDPERDTPDQLSEYAKSFNPGIIYLTGSNEEIASVLKAWKATRAKVASQNGEEDAYSMNHSSVLYLMTPDNRLAASYNWEIPLEQMVALIKSVLKR